MDLKSSTQIDAEIKDRLQLIQDRIRNTCIRCGRDFSEISLVAVTKHFPKSLVSKACALGITHLGENRLQECIEKYEDGWLEQEYPQVKLHLIGHLQSNKVRKAVQLFHSIDSLDSKKLADSVNQAASDINKQLRVLIEVNSSGEPQKNGVLPSEALELAEHVMRLEHLSLAGLMTVGPNVQDEASIRMSFQTMSDLFEKIGIQVRPPQWLALSMGMSHDFELAIESGATEIRIGTALFGERSYL